MKKRNVLILLVLVLCLSSLSFAEAEVQTLGTFKTGSCVTLKQTCSNCTFINTSVSVPPNQTTILFNQSMSRVSRNLWTFSFCNTSLNGEYIYDTYGDLNGAIETSSVNFFTNPIGKLLTSAQATLYFLIFVVSFLMFIVTIVFAAYTPGSNKRDAMTGYVIAVENMKYLKMFMWAIAYLVLMLMVYFGYIISFGYLDLDFLGSLFYAAFYFMVVLILPLFIVGTFVLISNAVRDHKVGEMLQRGFRVT